MAPSPPPAAAASSSPAPSPPPPNPPAPRSRNWLSPPNRGRCSSRRARVLAAPLGAQPRDYFGGDDLDLVGLVAVGDQDQLLHADGELGTQLGDAFVDGADDRRTLGRLAPGRIIPFLAEPFQHRRLDRHARWADIDRQLVGVEQARRGF